MLLENEQLKLRALEPEDLDLLYAWENNTEIWNVSNTLIPYSKFVLHQYIQNSHADIFESKQLRLIIELKHQKKNVAIGTIDLFDIDIYNKRAGIGILIAYEEFRRKGHAGQAIKLIENYVVEHLGLLQLYCHIDEDNGASLKLFEQTGYTKSGTFRNWKRKTGSWKDVYLLQKFF